MLKSDSHLSKKFCFIYFIESPLKMMEKSFYFILKALLVLMTFWSCWKNSLIRKIRLISKFMTSKPGEQTITLYILPTISQRKDNQTMKLGQLIEYMKRNIFLQKIMQKVRRGNLFQTSFYFLKKLNMR